MCSVSVVVVDDVVSEKKNCLDWEILERKVERERWVCVLCMYDVNDDL